MIEKLHPYVIFLPTEKKDKILSAIFGSKAGVDLLRFSLKQGISKNIYQKELVKKLNYSNKTIIENLKTLTKLGVLNENMEKDEKHSADSSGQFAISRLRGCGRDGDKDDGLRVFLFYSLRDLLGSVCTPRGLSVRLRCFLRNPPKAEPFHSAC